MKNYFIALLCILAFTNCKKEAVVEPVKEENLLFEVNAALSAISASGTFDFQVILKSKMPASGIRIEISATEEASGTPILPQSTANVSTTATTNVSVQNLPRQKWVEATVKVTSVSTPTNTASTKFRVIYK